MTYREMRNFTEMMQELGYPRLISMENFRTPNFPLVAEILIWLVKRFDPDADISTGISTESERVALLRSVAQLLVMKANLKLSTKKLYQADGFAVKEILKITTLLSDSLKTINSRNKDDLPEVSVLATAMKLQELKKGVQLVGDIVSSGASLHKLLGNEEEFREVRNEMVFRHLEMPQVEKAVDDSIRLILNEISNTQKSIEDFSTNTVSLDSKIEKKRSDLERHTKRLQTLKKIRPAFMEEFEKLEEELKMLYSSYVTKYRNLVFLENILEQTEQLASKKIDQKQALTKKLIEELKQDDEFLKSGDMGSEEFDNQKLQQETFGNTTKRFSTGVIDRPVRQKKAFGSMMGELSDSESQDSDSDLLLDGFITVNDEDEDDPDVEKNSDRNFSDDDF